MPFHYEKCSLQSVEIYASSLFTWTFANRDREWMEKNSNDDDDKGKKAEIYGSRDLQLLASFTIHVTGNGYHYFDAALSYLSHLSFCVL